MIGTTRAWLCIVCVALSSCVSACSSSPASKDLPDPSPSGAAGAQAASGTLPAVAQPSLSAAGTGGAPVAPPAAGSGGQPSAGHAAVDCDALTQALKDVLAAFKPRSPNTCVSDADCTIIPSAVYRSPGYCLDGCGFPVAAAYGEEYMAFKANDPGVTAACNAVLQAGCGFPGHTCPCALRDADSGCRAPRCVAATCQ